MVSHPNTPWDWTGTTTGPNGGFHCYIVDSTGRKIGTVWGPGAEKTARAHLWSGAPDMLAALQSFPGFTDDATVGDAWIEKMRAAIAKATGADQ